LYSKPIKLKETSTIRAVALKKGWVNSKQDSMVIEKHEWLDAMKVGNIEQGISYQYYEPQTPSLDNNSAIVSKGIVSQISLEKKQQKSNFAFAFKGYIRVPQSKTYTFYLKSDDGSVLWIDGKKIIDNGGAHGALQKS